MALGVRWCRGARIGGVISNIARETPLGSVSGIPIVPTHNSTSGWYRR